MMYQGKIKNVVPEQSKVYFVVGIIAFAIILFITFRVAVAIGSGLNQNKISAAHGEGK